MTGSTIKAIDRESVHRIHSGQVVLDLQGVIKELVENAFDSGATSVDVRIKDHGLDTVEVVDNGSGIDQPDWEFIGLKHHTSKLPSLEELSQVSTFGFRGEAIAALCALCDSVTVVTATKETAPMGAVIKLGRNGAVVDDKGRVARQCGTTVTVSGLFRALPVRRKEFERTAKREFTKALGILTAYALVPASVSATDGKSGVRLKVEVIGAGKGGKRNTVLATDGRGALKSSVGAVWGPKALEGVVELDLELEVDVDKAMARREGIDATSQTVRVVGLISSAAWGQGRSSADRQYTYINGRPCTLPTVMRAVNDVYKSFNTNQYPLAILDLQIPTESVDINVSPDKRTIFVHSEANLIEALRRGLEEFFQPTRSSYAVGGASHTVKVTQRDSANDSGNASEAEDHGDASLQDSEAAADLVELEGDQDSDGEVELDDEDRTPRPSSRSSTRSSSRRKQDFTPPSTSSSIGLYSRSSAKRVGPHLVAPPRYTQQTLDTTTASWSPKRKTAVSSSSQSASLRAPATGREARASLRHSLAAFASQGDRRIVLADDDSDEEVVEVEPSNVSRKRAASSSEEVDGIRAHHEMREEDSERPWALSEEEGAPMSTSVINGRSPSPPQPLFAELKSPEPETPATVVMLPDATKTAEVEEETIIGENEESMVDEAEESPNAVIASVQETSVTSASPPPPPDLTDLQREAVHMDVDDYTTVTDGYRNEIRATGPTGQATLRFDLEKLQQRFATKKRRRTENPSSERNAFTTMREGAATKAAGISNRDAEAAEEALSRVISKADFARMEVLGQFNKGFIITRLKGHADEDGDVSGSDDLFIVDQHASDEKYNFETLQQTTVIKAQTLIKPRAMQLTVADELVAMENLDILRANGFEVDVDEDALPGRGERVSLKAMPVSKETTFDFHDLEQLLHMLSDASRPAGQMVRCTKARAMFAMRACRKSVMIGKSLTKSQMVTLLRNMGTIDQPWNCPHGRPTMRHLSSLVRSTLSRSGSDRIDWERVDL